MRKTTILVNQKPFPLEDTTITPQFLRGLVDAPNDYEVWKVVGSPDPEGQLPLDDEQVTGPITAKSGDRFRVVPPGTFGSEESLPPAISEALQTLVESGLDARASKNCQMVYFIIEKFPLPGGYNKPSTTVLLKIPLSFPNGKPDMFWSDVDLRLQNGSMPKQTSHETILGNQWLRFSWHPQNWNPSRDNINTFIEFITRGLQGARQ